MVKNSGGSKAKSFARKNFVDSSPLRLILSPDERYAVVLKLFGGSICQVLSHDNIIYNAIIRGKLRGKSKRSNFISVSSLVIISIRDFSSQNTSDIVHVYSSVHFNVFKLLPSFPSHLFPSNNDNNNDFLFSNNDDHHLPIHELIHADDEPIISSNNNHHFDLNFDDI